MKIAETIGKSCVVLGGVCGVLGVFFSGQAYYQSKVKKKIEKKINSIEPVYTQYSNELNDLYKEIDDHKDDEAWMEEYKDKSSMTANMGTRLYELKGVLTDL